MDLINSIQKSNERLRIFFQRLGKSTPSTSAEAPNAPDDNSAPSALNNDGDAKHNWEHLEFAGTAMDILY